MSAQDLSDYVMLTCREIKASCDRLVDYHDLIQDTSMPPAGAMVIMDRAIPELERIYDKIDKLQSDVAGWAVVHCVENE